MIHLYDSRNTGVIHVSGLCVLAFVFVVRLLMRLCKEAWFSRINEIWNRGCDEGTLVYFREHLFQIIIKNQGLQLKFGSYFQLLDIPYFNYRPF